MAIKKKNNSIFVYGAIALALGGAAAFAINKYAGNKISKDTSNYVSRMASSHENASIAIATTIGTMPSMSRAFPDRSILFNSLPSPSVEHLEPFDSNGRYSTIAGAFDRCDAVDPFF